MRRMANLIHLRGAVLGTALTLLCATAGALQSGTSPTGTLCCRSYAAQNEHR